MAPRLILHTLNTHHTEAIGSKSGARQTYVLIPAGPVWIDLGDGTVVWGVKQLSFSKLHSFTCG